MTRRHDRACDIHLTRVTLVLAIVFLAACESPTENPIATCGSVAVRESTELTCVTLRLRVNRLFNAGADGSLGVENRCDHAIAVLSAPIDTRVTSVDAYE